MSLELTHQQIEELLGAYALDAVDPDEWDAIDLHLRGCPRCRAEVAEHREVAALLAHTGAPAPEGVWSRILAELEPAPPALRMPAMPAPSAGAGQAPGSDTPDEPAGAPPADDRDSAVDTGQVPAPVVDLPSRRSKALTRVFVAVVAAAAIIVAVLGIVTVRQNQRLDRLDASLREVSVNRIASNALSDPQATTGKLSSGDGRVIAPVVLDSTGKGYLFASKLPELPRNRIYQLWGQAGTSLVSLGLFDGRTDVVQFQVGEGLRRDIGKLLVTQEASPGVAVTKQQPILAGAV